jgi:hypothetical protein
VEYHEQELMNFAVEEYDVEHLSTAFSQLASHVSGFKD